MGSGAPQSSLRLLVVDDDVETYQRVREILRVNTQQDFAVEWLADGSAALGAINKNEHDCYLIDERVGETSGIVLLRQALANERAVPIIFLVSHNQEQLVQQALASGAAATLERHNLTEENLPRTIFYTQQHKQVRSRIGHRRTRASKPSEVAPVEWTPRIEQ